MQNDSTMRLIRFAVGLSLIAVSAIGSGLAHSPVELTQVTGQEALANRFDSPVSETDFRLSDHQQLREYFRAGSHDRLR